MAAKKADSNTRMKAGKYYASAINARELDKGRRGRWATKVGARGALRIAADDSMIDEGNRPDSVKGITVRARKPTAKKTGGR